MSQYKITKPQPTWTNADWREYMKIPVAQRAAVFPAAPAQRNNGAAKSESLLLMLANGAFCQVIALGLMLVLHPTWPRVSELAVMPLWIAIHWKIPTNRREVSVTIAAVGLEFVVFALLFIAWSRLGLHWLFGAIAVLWGLGNRGFIFDLPMTILGLITLYYGSFWGGCLLLSLSAVPSWRWGKHPSICWTRLPA
jgi:hypothetical protein